MTDRELRNAATRLYHAKPVSFNNSMKAREHDKTPLGFGVYALWDGDELLYVGYTRTNIRAASSKFCGIKGRLHEHRYGGGSFGLALLMVRIARTYTKEDWDQIAIGKDGFHKPSQNYVRKNMTYTFFETSTAQDAKQLEKWLHENEAQPPLLNMLRKKFAKAAKNKMDGE